MRAPAFLALSVFLIASPSASLAAPGKAAGAAVTSPGQEIMLDAIVASVDDKPITLSDLSKRLSPPRKLSFKEASKDQDALKVLDAMILERLLELEAAAKHLSISDEEVEDYINEVAARNSLSRPDFEVALKKEGQTIETYRNQIRFDILRTKLMSTMMHGGVSVSDGEIDDYIAAHPELSKSGTILKLSVISIASEGRSQEQVETKIAEVIGALDAGDAFSEVAKRFSDGPNAQEGGSLGIVAEGDLSPQIFESVFSLDADQHTPPLRSERGAQIFFVEQRFSAIDDDEEAREEAIRKEVKATLQKQKSQDRMSSFFINDLYKHHAVDKKL
jgi:peptidyl-prolyl cis-trans isomerase SurA